MSFSDVEQNGGFFSLEFDEKAMLYLKEKAGLELDQIEFIACGSRAEILSHLYSARIKMTELIPNHELFDELENGGVA